MMTLFKSKLLALCFFSFGIILIKILVTDPYIINCGYILTDGPRPIAQNREQRYLAKVSEKPAKCRGGNRVQAYSQTPWVDWTHYWGAAGQQSLSDVKMWFLSLLSPDERGINGAIIDLEYQRVELLKFNLFNSMPLASHIDGKVVKRWDYFNLSEQDPRYHKIKQDNGQLCWGDLIRFRTIDGICNDIFNPTMGASEQLFARNVQFDETFPTIKPKQWIKDRHADRIDLLKPDPQVISRKLFTREQSQPQACQTGKGREDSTLSHCDYKKAPFMNVLGAYWIQFMTHDWFSHLNKSARNSEQLMFMGCTEEKVDNKEVALNPESQKMLACRPEDQVEEALIAGVYTGSPLDRPKKTTKNFNTAWWDASQIYGFDSTSSLRVKRDPKDPAKLTLIKDSQDPLEAYLPQFKTCEHLDAACVSDPIAPEWRGQEAAGFADNWTIGMSFYHNIFAREHNSFVSHFREQALLTPDADSGLRHPDRPEKEITYSEVSDDELFGAARLVVSAVIAKIHTIEWTTQLLYNDPLHKGMNSNWFGILKDHPLVDKALRQVVEGLRTSEDQTKSVGLYSVLVNGPGMAGAGSYLPNWDLAKPQSVNGGVNHFGKPFNFPEEFITVYRLHSLLPDLIEMRDLDKPNDIGFQYPIVDSFRGKATAAMREQGIGNWALSMGRQRLGLLALNNSPQFLQNLAMPIRYANTKTQTLDVIALDIIRDRERGIPRFNEFRRQYGLKQLSSFDDFIDLQLLNIAEPTPSQQSALTEQKRLVESLREVYGSHICQQDKIISYSQIDPNGTKGQDGQYYPNDCLGKADGERVDNVEDLDTFVGWHAETTRPHGYAISETQFQVFLLNASRRLFSDRFLTSSFRPEFYTRLGYEWVHHNGPDGIVLEKTLNNGHQQEVSPFKRVLLRAIPALESQLSDVVNVFDPWARDRGEYYSLEWKAKESAKSDKAFEE